VVTGEGFEPSKLFAMDLRTKSGKPVTTENACPPATSVRIPPKLPTTTDYSRTPSEQFAFHAVVPRRARTSDRGHHG
jgi:hypothetical protein